MQIRFAVEQFASQSVVTFTFRLDGSASVEVSDGATAISRDISWREIGQLGGALLSAAAEMTHRD